jgi:hypothetical protein
MLLHFKWINRKPVLLPNGEVTEQSSGWELTLEVSWSSIFALVRRLVVSFLEEGVYTLFRLLNLNALSALSLPKT